MKIAIRRDTKLRKTPAYITLRLRKMAGVYFVVRKVKGVWYKIDTAENLNDAAEKYARLRGINLDTLEKSPD